VRKEPPGGGAGGGDQSRRIFGLKDIELAGNWCEAQATHAIITHCHVSNNFFFSFWC